MTVDAAAPVGPTAKPTPRGIRFSLRRLLISVAFFAVALAAGFVWPLPVMFGRWLAIATAIAGLVLLVSQKSKRFVLIATVCAGTSVVICLTINDFVDRAVGARGELIEAAGGHVIYERKSFCGVSSRWAIDDVSFNRRAPSDSLSSLAHAPELRRLEIDGSQFPPEALAELRIVPQLTSLSIWDVPLQGDDLRHLAHLHKLRHLRISGFPVFRRKQVTNPVDLSDKSLAVLAGLPRLESLSLSHCGISDDEMKHLAGIKTLRKLDLSGEFSDAGIAHLTGLDRLEELDLSFTKISDASIAHLALLPSLKRLELAKTKITDDGTRHFASMAALRSLNLSETAVGDAGMKFIGQATSLETLYLRKTRITGAGLEHLASLKQLRRLNCRDTRVTVAGLAKLRQLLPQCEVDAK